MIREIERARPMYLVSVLMNDSWLYRPESDPLIFTWANEYIAQNYVPAGFVNITPTEHRLLFRRRSLIGRNSKGLHPDLQTKALSRLVSKFSAARAQN